MSNRIYGCSPPSPFFITIAAIRRIENDMNKRRRKTREFVCRHNKRIHPYVRFIYSFGMCSHLPIKSEFYGIGEGGSRVYYSHQMTNVGIHEGIHCLRAKFSISSIRDNFLAVWGLFFRHKIPRCYFGRNHDHYSPIWIAYLYRVWPTRYIQRSSADTTYVKSIFI